MSIVYLNGDFLPMQQARISPMDRGFLFGDGIYEVIPSYGGRTVGLKPHLLRLAEGLSAIGIAMPSMDWEGLVEQLLVRNGSGNLGVYIHVSRGTDTRRFHAYPDATKVPPTVYAFAFSIAAEPVPDPNQAKAYRVALSEDKRWRRCHIKSTALLGNVMHFQEGYGAGLDETILYNSEGEVTEASACNVFIVKAGKVFTPPLDHQLLPGITRQILLDILRRDGSMNVVEQPVTLQQLSEADEVWLTSSSKEIAPVVEVAGVPVADGRIGPCWQTAQTLFSQHKYEY
ncbi:MAG TPA: aminotransferase class IV [Pseudomonadales bacterium]|nr:aminotransferase class IV [Pseudomonadales bacterium]